MNQIRARIMVAPDHRITGMAPDAVPPGEHEVTVTVALAPARQSARRPFDVAALPVVDLGPWPEGVTLRREEIYGDDGR